MPAIDARYRVVNDVPSLFRLHPARFVNVGAGGQNQGGNVFRIGGCNLDANGGASMVADDRRATNAERNQELVRGLLLPALAIFLTVTSFNLLGDGLRRTLDVRLAESGR